MKPLTSGTGADPALGGVGGQETDRIRTGGAVHESMRESTGRPESVGSDSGYSATSTGSHPAHLEVTPGVLDPGSSTEMPQEAITPDGVSNDTLSSGISNHGSLHGKMLPIRALSEVLPGDKLYKKTVYNTLTYHTSRSSNGTCTEADLPDRCTTLDGVVVPDRTSADGAKLQNSALPNGVDGVQSAPCPAPVILINGDLDSMHPPHVTVTLDDSNQDQHMSQTPINNSQTEDAVILPDRFRRNANQQKGSQQCKCGHIDSPVTMATHTANGEESRCGGQGVVTSHRCEACSRSPSPHLDAQEDTPERRAQDVTTAIQWLRQQMLQMKAQDKVLMRQFLELRASIHGLRGVGLTPSSVTDLTASSRPLMAAPCNSLPRLSPDSHQVAPRVHALPGDECEVEFRARTVSALPSRPRSKLQVRAFSKEFV